MQNSRKRKMTKEAKFSPETKVQLEKEGRKYLLAWYDYLTLLIRKNINKNTSGLLLIFSGVFVITIIVSFVLLRILINGVDIKVLIPSFSIPNLELIKTSSISSVMSVYDPMILLEKIKKGDKDYKLIDIRSFDEFEQGHIKTAISIPVYGTNLIKKDGSLDAGLIKRSFKEKAGSTNLVIIYGHTEFSTYTKQVASLIDKGGNRVKALLIGWNEWAHFKTLWVPEKEWNSVDPAKFIQRKEGN